MTMRYTSSGAREGEFIPSVRNTDMRGCNSATLTKQAIVVEGRSPMAQIAHVTIANCQFPNTIRGNTITNAARVRLIGNRTAEAK